MNSATSSVVIATPSSKPVRYRPEIDGLRGIAVLSVLLFHAGGSVPGGFVGVDIFFVISGYLITQIILRAIADDSFTIVGFYERRIRRILPALYFVIGVCLLVGYWLLMPQDFKALADSAIAQVFMLSNVYFYSRTGYFDTTGEVTPLLHTWSLSLEEQFYLFYPLLVCLLAKHRKVVALLSILALTLLSFVACVVFTNSHPEASFYLLTARAWELLAGSVLAYIPARSREVRLGSEISGWFGLGLIATSLFGFNSETSFPGYAAALPVIGTVMILGSSHFGRVSSIIGVLSLPPLRFVGLISYSLYLWHWPILAFLRYRYESLTKSDYAIAVLASLLLAILSWRLIETPVRTKALAGDARRLVLATLLSAGLILGACGSIEASKGFPGRFDHDIGLLIEDTYWNGEQFALELDSSFDPLTVPSLGVESSEGILPDFIIWGDSHAMVLADVIDKVAKSHSLHGKIIATHAVPPIPLGEHSLNQRARNQAVLNYIINSRPSTVVLVARWGSHYGPRTGSLGARNAVQNSEALQISRDHQSSDANMDPKQAFFKLAQRLTNLGIKVWFVSQIPETGEPNNARDFLMWIVGRRPNPPNRVRSLTDHLQQQSYANELLASAELANANLIDPASYFFDSNGRTVNYRSDRAVYRDDDHLTRWGAASLEPIFERILHGQ